MTLVIVSSVFQIRERQADMYVNPPFWWIYIVSFYNIKSIMKIILSVFLKQLLVVHDLKFNLREEYKKFICWLIWNI